MKSATANQLLGVYLRDATPEALDIGCLVMDKVAPEQKLKRGTLEGWYNCNEIVLGHKTLAVIWWYRGKSGNGMYVEAVAAIGNEKVTWECILEAVDIIVAKNNFKFVQVEAVRLGMICKLKEAGYTPTGLMMRKTYD